MSLNEKNIIHVVGEDIADPHVEVRIRLRANVEEHALESCYEVHAPGGMPGAEYEGCSCERGEGA